MYILDILQKNTIHLNEDDISSVHNLFKTQLRKRYAYLCYEMNLGDLVYSIRNTKLRVMYTTEKKEQFELSSNLFRLILNYLNIDDYNNFRNAVQGKVNSRWRPFSVFPALPYNGQIVNDGPRRDKFKSTLEQRLIELMRYL